MFYLTAFNMPISSLQDQEQDKDYRDARKNNRRKSSQPHQDARQVPTG